MASNGIAEGQGNQRALSGGTLTRQLHKEQWREYIVTPPLTHRGPRAPAGCTQAAFQVTRWLGAIVSRDLSPEVGAAC